MTMSVQARIKTSWPWITLLLTAAAALNPVGLDFLHGAFMSNEQLSRNIARPIVFMIGGVLGVLYVLEFGIRQYLVKKHVAAVSSHSDRGPH
ncbi:hypothetical protein HNQ36_000133 [Afipia massiliensis]|uniref:Uncharacterized protein n=1 Tax=Afipia massiliensis TaxID=211460 RepID=A0A840MQV9_9BRAD|nr:hypothetical protein [Afipia massiliensis]MBB5050185.1 hypothetical protein [Afipia massiliensis]